MSSIRATLGLALDRSVRDSFAEMRKLAKDTESAVNRSMTIRGGGRGGASNPELVAARAAYAEQSKLNREIFKQQVASARQLASEDKKLSRERTRERLAALQLEAREHLRQNRVVEAAATREHMAALSKRSFSRDRDLDRLATRTSHRATRFIFPRPEGAIGFAHRTMNDLLRGAGIDMSLSGGVARAKDLNETAQLLSQNAYQPGEKGAAGQQVGAEILQKEAHARAEKYGLKGGAQEVLSGQTNFVKITGDLETARTLTGDIAKLSAATGANFTEAMEASASLSKKLGEIPDKAKVIYGLMRGMAWQGKLGAVEIGDLAKTMPRLISGVTRFKGDTGQNIMKLGALAQMARGGAASNARESATGVSRMVDMFTTPTRVKAMMKLGLHKSDLFDKSGLLNDPFEIIKKALVRTKGDPLLMQKMFSSVMGSRPISRFTDLYRQGGLKAIDKEEKTLMSGSDTGMSEEVVQKMAEEYSQTMAAKAASFQEKMDVITESLATKLLPALEQLAPWALKMTQAFSSFVTWATENPGKIVALAISAAIARALTESFLRGLLERAIKGAVGGGTGGPGSGGSGGGFVRNGPGVKGVLGNTSWGGALSAVGAGVGLGMGVYSAIDYAGKSSYDEGVKTTNDISGGLKNVHGAELGGALAEAKQKLKEYQEKKGFFGGLGSDFMNLLGAGDEADVKGLEALIAKKRGEFEQWRASGGKMSEGTKKDIAAEQVVAGYGKQSDLDVNALAKATTDGLKGQTLNVRVTNAGDIGKNTADSGPSVDPSGRAGPPKK